MIFEFLFKKRLKAAHKKEQELTEEVRALESDIVSLKDQLSFEKNRYERILYVLNERDNSNTKSFIETTTKGATILMLLNAKEKEVEVFDLDIVDTKLKKEPSVWVKLWDNIRPKEVFIQDYQTSNKGLVQVSMKQMFKFVDEKIKQKITWKVKNINDCKEKEEFFTLYEDMGFRIKYFPKGNSK